MKKILTFLTVILVLLILSGCTTVNVNKMTLDQTINSILTKNLKVFNKNYDGYKMYIPRGLGIVEKNDYNLQILYNDTSFYLYVDIVGFYHKTTNSYTVDKSKYFSRIISYGSSIGYINIEKYNENNYYVEYYYNYGKIEAIVSEKDLKDAVLNMTYILSSIQYNENVISTLMGENVLNYKEEKIDLFESKGDRNNFLEAMEKYDTYEEKNEKDDDILDFEELE